MAREKVKVDRKLLLEVAENARIQLSEEELKEFLPQLQEILQAFSEIEKVDVTDTNPSFQPIPLKNVWREDEVEKCLSQDEALSNTRHKEKGYFKGPRVV